MARNVARAVDFKPPTHRISEADADDICRPFGISAEYLPAVRTRLDEITTAFAAAIAGESAGPCRKDDQLAMKRAVRCLQNSGHYLRRLPGTSGQHGLAVAGRRIAPAITVGWMRKHFGNDPTVPNPILWPPHAPGRDDLRTSLRALDADDLSLHPRVSFVGSHAADVFTALIADITDALNTGRRAIVQLPRGRKPLKYRAYMLAALAELWHDLGRRPTCGVNSKFGAFCEAVFEAIGWPTEGVTAALPEALADWRQLYRR